MIDFKVASSSQTKASLINDDENEHFEDVKLPTEFEDNEEFLGEKSKKEKDLLLVQGSWVHAKNIG